ncbi:class A beta-lactamase [Ideonella sp. BN130291]|uniref:class A beta-lactamase n=1 Tax=Ideonella sp. BN130291 TaxID=3112940 RepID=UPI002E25782D|nr:class A beta-lactamase [Ideonella sp. BN130291]
MSGAIRRRTLLWSLLPWAASGAARAAPADASAALAALQARTGGRIGVYALDTASRAELAFNASERFAMCSTFKLLLAAAVLHQVDAKAIALEEAVPYGQADMVPHAPVTSAHLAEGRLSVETLCQAIVEVSDNPAANLLLRRIGGPAKLTRFVRGLGDTVTRLDRYELALNSNLPGDERDTTTPKAMVRTVEKLLTADVLSAASRERLISWLAASPTGLQRLRAGLPPGWKVGDKTGTGTRGAVNDVAIAWPPGRPPILVACYLSGSSWSTERLAEVHAEVGRLVAQAFTG